MHTALTVRSFTPPPVTALSDEARIQLRAARMWVMLARHHRNPKPVLAGLLGEGTAAFCTLMEQLVTSWPDSFTTFPPCAAAVSPDEATLLGLLDRAATDDAAGAMRLLQGLLPGVTSERLWTLAVGATSWPHDRTWR